MDRQLENFYRAWCTPELRLLGFRLRRPYCLGTALLLEGIGSPFAACHESGDGFKVTAGDLVTALRVCQGATWPFNFVDLRPRLRDRVLQFWLERDPVRIKRAAVQLLAWILACGARPEYWQSESESTGPSLTAPNLLARAVRLLKNTPLPEERIWSMPVGMVSWYDGAIAEQAGGNLRFFYDSDLEEVSKLPDLTTLTTEEAFEMAREQMGEEAAERWMMRVREAANSHGES